MFAVIGANGYLGSYIIKAILKETPETIIATTRNLKYIKLNEHVKWLYCDVQDDESVNNLVKKLKEENNVKIVYLAAYHHPDKVEANKSLAWDINVTSLSKLINKVSFVTKFYYVSTDCVYGESKEMYHFKEMDHLNPVNTYGHNKCAAEAITIHAGYNVVRFPFLISPSIVYKKHFYDEIVDTIKNKKEIEMYKDSYRSSLSFENAGRLLVRVMRKPASPKILNICGDKDLSKYDVALRIAEREHLDKQYIIPVTMNTPKKNFIVQRAGNTLMDNSELKRLLALKQIDIFESPN